MPFHHCIIIPAKNEAACLARTIVEIQGFTRRADSKFTIIVGLNATDDDSKEILKDYDVLVGETKNSGYGYGCLAAIETAQGSHESFDSYIFMAADGANDPAELPDLIHPYESGQSPFIVGQRTFLRKNLPQLGLVRALANVLLGGIVGFLTGRFFSDLGPFRLIDRELFHAMNPKELTWGWTIEPMVVAASQGIFIKSLTVSERSRIAGEQKVTGVSLRHSLLILKEIAQAAIRSARRAENPLPSSQKV